MCFPCKVGSLSASIYSMQAEQLSLTKFWISEISVHFFFSNLLIIQFAGTLMALKRASSGWEDGDGSEAPRHESKRRLAFTRWVV